ncbi:hypothetical protein LXL04_022876 [Taraxacum kok-saghyz]
MICNISDELNDREHHKICITKALSLRLFTENVNNQRKRSKTEQSRFTLRKCCFLRITGNNLDDDLVNSWATSLADDGLWGNNAPTMNMNKVNEFLAGAGTDAPIVDEGNISRSFENSYILENPRTPKPVRKTDERSNM